MKLVHEETLKPELGKLFKERSSRYITNKRSLYKFKSVWKLVDRFGIEQELRVFLSQAGDCKYFKFLFACIFFNCHTESSVKYIENSFRDSSNLQGRKAVDFSYDLLIGWIFELFIFEKFGLKKSGCDSDYILYKGKSVNSGADFSLNNQLIELVVDNNGLTCNKDILHLRYNKWDKLLEDDMFLFVLCPNDMKYFLNYSRYLAETLDVKRLDAIPAFSKYKDVPGVEIKGWNNIHCFDLTIENLNKSFGNLTGSNPQG